MQQTSCHFCGNKVDYIHVHGHYQCPVCHTNALPCCDGDNCNTNVTWMHPEEKIKVSDSVTKPAYRTGRPETPDTKLLVTPPYRIASGFQQ